MGVRTIAVAIFLIFAFVVLGSTLAGPLTTVADDLNSTGDYSDVGGQDGNKIITDLPGMWFNGVLIGVFGVMVWATWFVLRRELTRGQL